jgi:hypothetical protein
MYAMKILINQGGPCSSERLPFRIVAGVWTLAAFVFVHAYNLTLHLLSDPNETLTN